MATWGAYLTSYVKKKDEAPQVEEISEKPSTAKPNKPFVNTWTSPNNQVGFQDFNATTKKLYGSPIESTTTEPFQRSNSNAARVAKMFGYATPTPAQVDGTAVPGVQAKPQIVEPIQSAPYARNYPVRSVSLDRTPNFLNNEMPVGQNSRVVGGRSSSYRKKYARGQGSSASLDLDMIMNDIQELTNMQTFTDTQTLTEEEENNTNERTIPEYMRQSEQIQMERERMESERKRILEEQSIFQKEADRFAEEEEQMKKFIEDVNRERGRERENEERKMRQEKEAREREARQKAAPQVNGVGGLSDSDIRERKRFKQLEDERLAREEADRLNEEIRKYEEEVEAERQRYEEEEAKLRAQRMKDEKKAKQQKRAAREREERLRYEEEEARQNALRIEDERVAKEERRAAKEKEEARLEAQRLEDEAERQIVAAKALAERMWLEEEQARLDAQRKEDERLAKQQRRAAQEREKQLRYEEEEPEVVTKEDEIRKAEEKIRAAFAGLAVERAQASGTSKPQLKGSELPVGNPTKGVKPAGRGSRIDKADVSIGAERGVSRFNTVAGRPQIQVQPLGVARGNTVGARSPGLVQKKLPNAPRGMGLPSGPRAGLPSGPRPRRQT